MEAMSEGAPLVSIIVPVYNAAATLERCVRSVTAQTLPDWELILVDNASADDSPAIARAWAARDARVRTASQRARGVSPTRNLGLDMARGEFVFFLDSDDALVPEALARMEGEARHTGCDIVFPAMERVAPGQAARGAVTAAYAHAAGQADIARVFAHGLGHYGLFNIFALYRRALLEAPPPLRLDEGMSLGEDVMLNLAAMARAASISLLAQPLYLYTFQFGADSLNTRYRPDMADIKLTLQTAIRAFIEARGAWDGQAEQAFAAMQAQDLFMCVSNLTRVPGGGKARREAFRALLAREQVARLVAGRRRWRLSIGKRFFLAALATGSYALARVAVWAYRVMNGQAGESKRSIK